MDFNNLLKDIEAKLKNFDSNLQIARQKVQGIDQLEEKIKESLNFNRISNKINKYRDYVLKISKIEFENFLHSLKNEKLERKNLSKISFQHSIELEAFDFVSLVYQNEITIFKKLNYSAFYDTIKFIQVPAEYRDKSYFLVQPISLDKYLVYDKSFKKLLLLKKNGKILKTKSLYQHCEVHVFNSKIFLSFFNLKQKASSIQVYDSNFSLLNSKHLTNARHIHFFNSNFIKFSDQDLEPNQVYDSDLNLIYSFSKEEVFVRSPILDFTNNRIFYLFSTESDNCLFLNIATIESRLLIGKIKLDSYYFFIRVDSEANLYIKTHDADLICYNKHGELLFKRYWRQLENYHNFIPVDSNLMAFYNIRTNNFALI